ncbi:DedA family protein [Kaistia dalseonensis]|uniref:Membrane protein DedA with SNARE-associated domain n=1 Tax=Kaistia dalseonensis TaxID=410840 RepID=A0ABU0H1F4_9HYPH|nr:DedA family protein [Kaistia dalseonensis]MCX5493310.1 DedA family protein [Kaistia dalseonensis]MDQ0435867.1 membrane protein DedA with SNARE-associated domain [Kaistia dalseonensis]
MTHWVQVIIDLIAQHPHWTNWAVFLTAMTESLAIVGIFVPGTAILIAVGSVAGLGHVSLGAVIFFAILGAIIGDGISYWLGHRYKALIPTVWPFRQRPGILALGEAFFRSHGAKSVFIGRFVPTIRAIIPLVAGIVGMKPARFYVANVLSAAVWGPAHILPGAFIGLSLDWLDLPADRVVPWSIGAIVVALLGYVLFKLVARRYQRVGRG